jgi:predicted DNA-binding transcriptional regulator AlpA
MPRTTRCPPLANIEPLKPNVLLDVNDVAAALRTSPSTVFRMARYGRLPKPVHLGAGMTRWKSNDVLLWFANLQA